MRDIILLLLILLASISDLFGQACATCASDSGDSYVGLNFAIPLGKVNYGVSVGELRCSSGLPSPILYTPVALRFTGPMRSNVSLITSKVNVTNVYIWTNRVPVSGFITNASTTKTRSITNVEYSGDIEFVTKTETNAIVETKSAIRQVLTPTVFVDVPPPPTTNGYVINVYRAGQVTGTNVNGLYQLRAESLPFVSWIVTNPVATGTNQIQVSKFGINPAYGLMSQSTFVYSPEMNTWTTLPTGNLWQEVATIEDLGSGLSQVRHQTLEKQGALVKQRKTVYQGGFRIRDEVEDDTNPQVKSYTYNSRGLLESTKNSDGSIERLFYDVNNRLTNRASSFGDSENGRETVYYPDPKSAQTEDSGDDGTLNPLVDRCVVQKINGVEVSRSYTVYPSLDKRLDIQCTISGAKWSEKSNLITTNVFYTNGANKFCLRAVIQPDGTMTTYDYCTNANNTLKTNIVISGEANAKFTAVVDGTCNIKVVNQAGYTVAEIASDVKSNQILKRDIYANFDGFGQPQQVTHLDRTTEYTEYACCGLESTTDKDGVIKTYLHDPAKRQVGYVQSFGKDFVIYTNVLDAAGRVVEARRIGWDNSVVRLKGTRYDLAGEIVAETNALGGVTSHSRANDPNTGGLIRVTVNPDDGSVTNFYYCDGSLKVTVGTAVHGVAYGYGVDTDSSGNVCTYTAQTNLDNGTLTGEWKKTFVDAVGRTTEILYSDGSRSRSFYNNKGQLSKQIDPDGVTTLYQYGGKGEVTLSALSLSQSDTPDLAYDRASGTAADVASRDGASVGRIHSYVWGKSGSAVSNLVSVSESSTDGLKLWHTIYGEENMGAPQTTFSQTKYSGNRRTVTATAADGSYSIMVYSFGRLESVSRFDANGNQIGSASYEYDPHGRQSAITDARNGTTFYSYNDADLVQSVTTPDPQVPGGSPQTTTTHYDTMLRATRVVSADGGTVINQYHPTGELKQSSGTRIYPVGYGYDYAGRLKHMTNWSSFAGLEGARVTTWNYDSRGRLWSKDFPDPTTGNPPVLSGTNGPVYTYTVGGRLKTGKWLRGTLTTYGYGFEGASGNRHGDIVSITYSDDTPGVTNTYDRRGRLSTVLCDGMISSNTYSFANGFLSESFSGKGSPLDGISVVRGYDALNRRDSLTISDLRRNKKLDSWSYGYDAASRLKTVSEDENAATYDYLANSRLVQNIHFTQNGGQDRMTTLKAYDKLNRLWSISSTTGSKNTYAYDAANQRVRNSLADGSYWVYQFDSMGQVTSGKRYWSDDTPVEGQQFEYAQDDIGNRTLAKAGGSQRGTGLRTNSFVPNRLNQYESRTVPASFDVMGISDGDLSASVVVNKQSANRKSGYFRKEVKVDNSNGPVWQDVAVEQPGQATVSGKIFVPQTPEIFSYDADGNLTGDGRWTYAWDAENRLVSMKARTSVGPQQFIRFDYDSKGRRIRKQVWNSTNAKGSPAVDQRFVYDGWNVVAVLTPQQTLSSSFTWGLDLSGSQQGAGGVGGLLWIKDASSVGNQPSTHYVTYDGNGNITGLVDASSGTNSATYEYGPFGELIRATGPIAKDNPFRFSTKFTDDQSDLVYYGYRYYNPSTGRWLSRDPAQENGGINLYGTGNDFVGSVDSLGLSIVCDCKLVGYLSENGITRDMYDILADTPSVFQTTYSAKEGVNWNPCTTDQEILWGMLRSTRNFTVKDLNVANLKLHVGARRKIVENALASRVRFGHNDNILAPSPSRNPSTQAYYDSLNVESTVVGCHIWTLIIFQTGNNYSFLGQRPLEDVWIPGDWGYIKNTANTDSHSANPTWSPGYEGENVIYVGGGLWWGLDESGIHPGRSQEWWWNEIRRWQSSAGVNGVPMWRDFIEYTGVGLQYP